MPEPGQHGDVSRGRVPELPHERHEQVRGAGLPQEGVVQQLGRGGALGGIAHQHLVQEAVQPGRDLRENSRCSNVTLKVFKLFSPFVTLVSAAACP